MLIGLQLAELGAVIQSSINLVPDGVVVFLPSYSFLDQIKASWSTSGLLDKLSEKKQVRQAPTVERHLIPSRSSTNRRAPATSRPSSGTTPLPFLRSAMSFVMSRKLMRGSQAQANRAESKSRKTGALMFAVVGGKLSEGSILSSLCVAVLTRLQGSILAMPLADASSW